MTTTTRRLAALASGALLALTALAVPTPAQAPASATPPGGEDVTAVQFQMGLAVTTRPLPAAAHALVPDVGGWLVEVYLRGLRPD